MKNVRVFSLTLAALSISMAAAITGCESADGEAVEISASKRDFSVKGESATLTASGWNDYRWSLSDTSIGRLSRETGASVTYTAIDIPAAGTSYKNQTVTCEALDSGGVSGSIVLRHVSEGGTASEPRAAATSITHRGQIAHLFAEYSNPDAISLRGRHGLRYSSL